MPNRAKSQYHLSLKSLLIFAWVVTPAVEFINKFVFSDWQFMIFLIVLVCIDTVLGFTHNLIAGTLSSQGFSKLFTKFIVYCCFLAATHVLKYYTVDGVRNTIFSWVDSFCYSTIIVREFMSILENIARVNPNVIPKAVMRRFKAFDKKGRLVATEGVDKF